MDYILSEEVNCDITKLDNLTVKIDVLDYEDLINYDLDELMKKIIYSYEIFNKIKFSKEIMDLVIDYIFDNVDASKLNDVLTNSGVPLYSLVIGSVSILKRKYTYLSKLSYADSIIVNCNKNNFLKALELSKKYNNVVINGQDISMEDYSALLTKIGYDNLDNYYTQVYYQQYNEKISLKELYELSDFISKEAEEIKRYNLSNIEKVMYVFDMVKSLQYKKEKEEEETASSRDLNEVLKSDSIVCMGYVAICVSLLRSLNINVAALNSKDANHQFFMAYIKDQKYNIDGVYTFDPVRDRKKNVNDKEYINSYSHFALPIDISNLYIKADDLELLETTFSNLVKYYSITYSNTKEISDALIASEELRKLFKLIGKNNFENYEKDLMTIEYCDFLKRNNIVEEYNDFQRKYHPSDIDITTFMDVLYNVRKVQLYNGIIDDFDIESIKNATLNRYSKIEKRKMLSKSGKEQLEALLKLFDCEDEIENNVKYENEEKNNKDILNVKLLKVLRKKLTTDEK